MKIQDISIDTEKSSPFYKNHLEIIKLWEKQAQQLNAASSGEFNSYMMNVAIEAKDPKILLKGQWQQYTAQSSTILPENSHSSESSLFEFQIKYSIGSLSISKPNAYNKLRLKLFKSKEKSFIYGGYHFQSDTLSSINWAKNSKAIKDIVWHPSFVGLKTKNNGRIMSLKLNKMLCTKEDFERLFQLMNGILSES